VKLSSWLSPCLSFLPERLHCCYIDRFSLLLPARLYYSSSRSLCIKMLRFSIWHWVSAFHTEIEHLALSFSISYWDFLTLRIPLKRGVRGVKARVKTRWRQGEFTDFLYYMRNVGTYIHSILTSSIVHPCYVLIPGSCMKFLHKHIIFLDNEYIGNCLWRVFLNIDIMEVFVVYKILLCIWRNTYWAEEPVKHFRKWNTCTCEHSVLWNVSLYFFLGYQRKLKIKKKLLIFTPCNAHSLRL